MRFHENTVRKSDVALMLPVLCLLVIAGISGTNVVSGAGSGSAPNQQIARGQNALQSGEVWSTSSLTGSPEVGCVQPLTSSLIDAYYSEPYCYGHDEAVLGFLSNQPGSGGNAVLNFSLPISAPSFPQGDFYIAFWVGGVVYDPSSLDNQAFMEFQFYPASPQYTGSGSGSKDCSSQGFFFNSGGLNSNQWFACVFVFAVNTTSFVEYIPYFAALDLSGLSDSIMVMNGNDLVSVGLSGAAKNGEPWQISLNDYTTGQQSALISLQNKSSIFSPFYDKSSASNALLWGADQSPAIDFAFEIGHSLANDCSSTSFSDGGTGGIPGDGSCDSYWPGLWSQTGLIHIYLPIVGTSPQLPSQISFSSSQGGVSEVYKSSQTKSLCKYPSFSTSVNCIYPFYVYEYNTSSFVFLSSRVSGSVNDYGNAYQFPGTNDTGQYISNIQPAPSPPTTVTTTKTATSVSTLTSTVITALTQTATVVSTVTEQQAHSLTVETRSPGGSALTGQTITISNLTGFSMQGTTDSSGQLVLTGLSLGSSYTASSNISGVTLSATVTLNGNSIILLEPTPAQTNHTSTTSTSSTSGPPPPFIQTPYLIFVIAAIAVVAIGSVLVFRRRP